MGSGGSNEAAAYRQSAQGVMNAAAYNIGIVNVNLGRELDSISTQIFKTTSTQRAQAAGTGFQISSKSFQMLTNETLNVSLRAADDAIKNAEYQRQKIWYEAQLQATSLENQARAAEIQGRAAQQQSMFGLISGITRLF